MAGRGAAGAVGSGNTFSGCMEEKVMETGRIK